MTELKPCPIDADAFYATMYEAWMNCEITNEEWFHFREMIQDEPTVEPKRMRGKWIGGELGRCSICGHEGNASDIWNGCKGMFCPNCGADMRGTE